MYDWMRELYLQEQFQKEQEAKRQAILSDQESQVPGADAGQPDADFNPLSDHTR